MIAPPEGLASHDFDQVEAAVLETERGRWFLQEYARRLRAAESAQILAEIQRLAGRDHAENVARRDAADAASAMIQALQKLSAYALGAPARETPPEPMRLPPQPSGDLDRRLAALKELDTLDVEAKVKLFG